METQRSVYKEVVHRICCTNYNWEKIAWAFSVLMILTLTALLFLYNRSPNNRLQEAKLPAATELRSISSMSPPENLKQILRTRDNSALHLIPSAELELADANEIGPSKISIKPFYMAESPITNQQFVTFLNGIIERIDVKESSVYLEDKLVLKLNEKIRGYKPIEYDNGRFVIKDPMHSACAVLLVTGFGAEAYAKHYGVRLPLAPEWYYIMLTNNGDHERIPLPTPVMNYKQDKYGLRAINQIAEWGKRRSKELVLLGQNPSSMIEGELIVKKTNEKYFTDTGFRIALDVP